MAQAYGMGFTGPFGQDPNTPNPASALDVYGLNSSTTQPSQNNLIPTGTGAQVVDIGNNFLDNPEAAVNNIMQQAGLSVGTNSPFYSRMKSLAPGLEWLQYFGGANGSPTSFLGNVGDWFNSAATSAGSGFSGAGSLGDIFSGILNGGGSPQASAMLDQMQPADIARALTSMIETADYGTYGSKMRQGLEGRVADLYNIFLGQQPNIEAGLAGGTASIAGAFTDFLKNNGLLGSLGLG